jgi:hypothetical protein
MLGEDCGARVKVFLNNQELSHPDWTNFFETRDTDQESAIVFNSLGPAAAPGLGSELSTGSSLLFQLYDKKRVEGEEKKLGEITVTVE